MKLNVHALKLTLKFLQDSPKPHYRGLQVGWHKFKTKIRACAHFWWENFCACVDSRRKIVPTNLQNSVLRFLGILQKNCQLSDVTPIHFQCEMSRYCSWGILQKNSTSIFSACVKFHVENCAFVKLTSDGWRFFFARIPKTVVLLISHVFGNCVGHCACISACFVLKSMRVKGHTQRNVKSAVQRFSGWLSIFLQDSQYTCLKIVYAIVHALVHVLY